MTSQVSETRSNDCIRDYPSVELSCANLLFTPTKKAFPLQRRRYIQLFLLISLAAAAAAADGDGDDDDDRFIIEQEMLSFCYLPRIEFR